MVIKFKYGTLMREERHIAEKMDYTAKWAATLDESVRNNYTNANLTILIRIYLAKFSWDPAPGDLSILEFADSDKNLRKVQPWAPNEFETFAWRLVHSAQRFWTGKFWLETPHNCNGLDWPDAKPTHRCNIYCKFSLARGFSEGDAHYTIPVARLWDGEKSYFRSNALLFSSRDTQKRPIPDLPKSSVKFWAHIHEVGHLIGLGHVGWDAAHRNTWSNEVMAYGVTRKDKEDVMGMGSVLHPWHARPWQQAAADLTATESEHWHVHMKRIMPRNLRYVPAAHAA